MSNQLIGEALTRPYQNIMRAKQSQSRANYSDARVAQMPQLMQLRDENQKARINAMLERNNVMRLNNQNRSRMTSERLRQMQLMLPYKISLIKSQIERAQNMSNSVQAGNALMKMQYAKNKLLEDAGGDINALTERQREEYDELERGIQKATGTSFAMKRTLQGRNVLDTFNNIDIEPLIYYSTPEGKLKLKIDQANAARGKAPDMYIRYKQTVLTDIPTAGDQLGQFFGSSVQHAAAEMRNQSIYEPSYLNNPEQIRRMFNSLKNLAETEYNNAKEANTDPNFYKAESRRPQENPKVSDNKAEPKPPQEKAKVSDDEIKLAMRAYPNLTREQIIKVLGG